MANGDQAAMVTPDVQPWTTSGVSGVPRPPLRQRIAWWTREPQPLTTSDRDPVKTSARWWWLGVHGGAGVSTLDRLVPGGRDAHRRWPDPLGSGHGGPAVVLLVCRTHLSGLSRCRSAAQQWAAHDTPAGLQLGGVMAVSDAPARLARPQLEALRLLEGIAPQVWVVPWVPELRLIDDPVDLGATPPSLLKLSAQLHALVPPDYRF